MRESGIPLNTDERSPTTPVSEWQNSQKEADAFNNKTMNAIFNVHSMKEFTRISKVEVAYTICYILQTVHKAQRQSRLASYNS